MKIRQHVAMWPLDAPLKKYLRTPLIEDINMERGTPYDLFYKQTPVVKALVIYKQIVIFIFCTICLASLAIILILFNMIEVHDYHCK